MFCPAIKLRIVERAGTKLQHLLPGLNSNPECTDRKCFLHQSGGQGSHSTESVVYKGECVTCLEEGPSSKPGRDDTVVPVQVRKPGTKAAYFGETGRSILVRGGQHLADIEAPESEKSKANAFVKHAKEYHNGEMPNYQLSIVGEHPKPLQRQIWEGVLIRRGEQELDVLMNSKLDHFAPAVGRVHISNAIIDHDL